jgi:hypothetical protein
VPLTTVTIDVELISPVPVGETEFEVDPKGGAEVEGVVVILERDGVVEVVGMRDDEDDIGIDVDDVGVLVVGVDGSIMDVNNEVALVYVINNVVSREH